MAYQSLYRKYRPQTFADVVGQGHVTRTLQNALASGRVAHGYLFTGTRGTAKTTVARLLAKALNCQSYAVPTPEPCNQCDACIRITAGACIDVIEMDAASHRGVADIEEVRKSVGYGPMEMRYKVFIIDEAHQLSSDAKDAFLKTLEEPPNNVVFVLATTEPQAIPITIRSRCQQFDFKRGSLNDIATRLKYVLDCEGVTYVPEALNLVARGAEGSYRDSLSLLEQVLAFSPRHISPADVDTVLGTLDAEALAQVTQAVAQKDAPTAFALAGQLLDAGKEARTLLRTLAGHFRDLLLVTVGGPAVSSELTQEEVQRLQQEQQMCRFSPPMLLRAIDALNEAQGETRWNNQHRLLVELTFLKLMTLDGGAEKASAGIAETTFSTAPIVFSATPQTPVAAAPQPLPPPVLPPRVTPTPPVAKREPAQTQTSTVAPPPPVVVAAPPAPAPEPTPVVEAKPEAPEELPSSFFANDRDDDEDALDEYGEDTVTTSLFGDDSEEEEDTATTVPVALPAPVAPPVSASPSPESVSSVEEDTPPDLDTPKPEIVPAVPDPVDEDEEEMAPFFGDEDAPAINPVAVAPSFLNALPWDDEDEDEPESPATIPSTLPAAIAPAIEAEEEKKAEQEEEDDGIRLELNQVQRAWPRFLQEATKISKQTEVMMAKAYPVEASGKIVTIAFSARMNYDRMNEPKKLEFVRKLLARCLDVSSVTVRFVLDENAPPPPPRAKNGEKKAIKRDPIAALEELNLLSALPPSSSSSQADNGFGGWNGFATAPAALPPVPKTVHPAEAQPPAGAGAFSPPPRSISPREEAASPAHNGYNGYSGNNGRNGVSEAEAKRRAVALENPLVQETLQVFGGDIVEE